MREGELPDDVIASYGFNLTTIYNTWLNAADDGGHEALRSAMATGHSPSLSQEREQQFAR